MKGVDTVIARLKDYENIIEDVGLQNVKLEKLSYNREVDMLSVVISYRDPTNCHKRQWAGTNI